MLKVILVKSDKERYDITDMVTSVSWSGDENTISRSADISFVNTDRVKRKTPLVSFEPGHMVMLYKDGQEFFRGFIFKKSIDQSGNESITAYDELIYLAKNNHTMMVKNKTASEVILSLFKQFGIPSKDIQATNYKIKKLVFTGSSLADIIADCLEETTNNTGRRYKLFSKQGAAYLWAREKTQAETVSIDDVIAASREISIEELKTQVLVTKGTLDSENKVEKKDSKVKKGDKDKKEDKPKNDDKFISSVSKNAAAIKKYGILQHVEEVSDEKVTVAQLKQKGDILLKQLSEPEETISIEFIGNIACTTGRAIRITNGLTGVLGKYYISSDSHTFSDGVHKMTLQLSKRVV